MRSAWAVTGWPSWGPSQTAPVPAAAGPPYGEPVTRPSSAPVGLGMPSLPPTPPSPAVPPLRDAWDRALYGPEGFFRRHRPAEHFRTAVHESDHLARALLVLIRRSGLDTVVDVGAGGGELLTALHHLDPTLRLLGIEVGPRPPSLPDAVRWASTPPDEIDGLLVAHEWLDNVPCHVAEVGDDGAARLLHAAPDGTESAGLALGEPGVPDSLRAWAEHWWPASEPGARIELGSSRDRAWAGMVARVRRGVALAVDYGHTRAERPPAGTLRSYQRGRLQPVRYDGTRDITADVAVDAVAQACRGRLIRQDDALRDLLPGLGQLPAAGHACEESAPSSAAGYLQELSEASLAAGLVSPEEFGGFWWVLTAVGVPDPLETPEPV